MKKLLFFVFMVSSQTIAYASSSENSTVSCRLGSKHKYTIKLFQSKPINDSYVYSIETGSNRKNLFEEEAESRGSNVKISCLGKNEKILLITGEFEGSNYPKGSVFRFNSHSRKLQRINFAERTEPNKIYLGKKDVVLIFPNKGPEYTSKYIRYRHAEGQGLVEESQPADILPTAKGLTLIQAH